MKRIAIFCDGTWNREDAKHATNVVKLHKAVTEKGADGIAQKTIYLRGPGERPDVKGLERVWDRLAGGAFGAGVTEIIEDGYRQLAQAYEPGDALYIFGFSRGAYLARSLVGLMRNCGIPEPGLLDRVPEAIERYRSRRRSDHPDASASLLFRADFSPLVATSKLDMDVRDAGPHSRVHLLSVAYVGVWDTVGALGLPRTLGFASRLMNRRYEFHDTDLSSRVASARHAIAVDERRRSFEPTTWKNLHDMTAHPDAEDSPYRQLWFPGTHGGVGGGGDIVGLSNITALWVAAGAAQAEGNGAGLGFDAEALDQLRAKVDLSVPVFNQTGGPDALHRLLGITARDRRGLKREAEIADEARKRWNLDPDPQDGRYRPRILARFLGWSRA